MANRMKFMLVLVPAFFAGLAFPCFVTAMQASGKPEQSDQQKKEEQEQEIGKWIPPGLSEAEKAEWKNGPPGWNKGKKTGWKGGDLPPGLAKKQGVNNPPLWSTWTKEQQNTWEGSLQNILDIIRQKADKTAVGTMVYSLESAARSGVPLQQLKTVTNQSMQWKLTATDYEKMTRAMEYGVERNADFPQLADFVNARIKQGTRGDELAVRIYKDIADHFTR